MKPNDIIVFIIGVVLLISISGLVIYTWWQGVKPLTGVVP